MQQTAALSISSAGRRRIAIGDPIFAGLAFAAGLVVLLLLGSIILSLFFGALPAFRAFGFGFLTSATWDPVHQVFGAAVSVYGTLLTSVLALAFAVPLAFGIAFFLTELAPNWMRRPVGTAVELLAAVPSIIYGMWGFFIIVPIMSQYVEPTLIDTFDGIPVLQDLFAGPPFGTGLLTAALILAVMIIPFISATMRDVFDTVPSVFKEFGLRRGLHHLGSDALDRAAVYTRVRGGRHHAGTWPCAWRDNGGDIRHRQRRSHLQQRVWFRQHDCLDRRARISGKPGRQPETCLAAGTRVHPVRHLIHRSGDLALPATATTEGIR